MGYLSVQNSGLGCPLTKQRFNSNLHISVACGNPQVSLLSRKAVIDW